MYLLRGKVHEAMDNRIPAIEDYKNALKYDVYCNEAFELLIRHEMLSPSEGIVEILIIECSSLNLFIYFRK